jgi:hypothetical protein
MSRTLVINFDNLNEPHMNETASTAVPGPPRAAYNEILHWRIADRPGRLLRINLLALPLGVVFGVGFVWLAQGVGKAPSLAWGARELIIFVAGVLGVLVLHEVVHGVFFRIFGAAPRFGVYRRGGMLYAKAPGFAFTRRQYLVILLGPLVGISLAASSGMGLLSGTPTVWFLALWAIVNASAANADVWMAAVILRYPPAVLVVDERDGLRILEKRQPR